MVQRLRTANPGLDGSAINARLSSLGKKMNDNGNRHGLGLLTLGALGVVYGDIGTSPLYTMKEVFHPANGVPLDAPDIIGAVSVIFWALMVVVTLKYVILILRADNRGEGGIMALTALAAGGTPTRRTLLLLTGVLGAALFYGDSVITPAISVLGAVRGAGGDHAHPETLRSSDLGHHHRCAVHGSALRHRGGRQAFRSGHQCVVLRARTRGCAADRAAAGHPGGTEPVGGRGVPACAWLAPVPRDGLDRAGVDRCRGAVCRHGALRGASDTHRVDGVRAAVARAQLHGAGGLADARSVGAGEPVLPAVPAGLVDPGGAAGHRGLGDRIASSDLGCVLDDQNKRSSSGCCRACAC